MFLMKKLNHKVVFIPTWLRQVQKVYGFDDKELLNLSKLLDILCVEDVAKYFAANNIFYSNDNFLPFTLTLGQHDFIKAARDNTSKENIETLLTKINELSIMDVTTFNNSESNTNSMTSIIKALEVPLGNYDSTLDLTENIRDNYVFELLPIDEEHFGITFVYNEGSKTVNECLTTSIELLCEKYPFEVVAQTPLFNYWVSTLNKVT